MSRQSFVSLGLLSLFISVLAVAEEPKGKKPAEVDANTIAAYAKLGAAHGALKVYPFEFPRFTSGKDAVGDDALPAFQFSRYQEGKLPPVGVAFGLAVKGQVSGAGFKELKQLTNLSALDLSGAGVTNAGLKELKELKNLTALNLNFTQVTDTGLKELRDLNNLTVLHLGYTRITNAGLKELKELKNLTTLNLAFTQVTNTGLKELTELKNLTMLYLGGPQVTDAGLKELKDVKNLTALYLQNAKVTVAGFKELKNLTTLFLGGPQVNDTALKELRELKNLSALHLGSSQVTVAGLKELKNLAMLDLRLTLVLAEEAQVLRKALPKCKIVTRLGLLAGDIDDDTIAAYKKLGFDYGVMEQDEGDWKFVDKKSMGVTAIPAFRLRGRTKFLAGKLPPVGIAFGLDLSGAGVTDAGLKQLKELKTLTALDLGGNKDVTAAGFKELKDLKNLTYLNLTGTFVKPAGIKELRDALPKCGIRKY